MNRQVNNERLRAIAKTLRINVVNQAMGSGQGYVGQGLQAADLFSTLFFSELDWDETRIDDPSRDRFLLSVGHYALILYAVFAELGLIEKSALATYGANGSNLSLGAEPGHIPGIEFAGGSLGQGLGTACGIAWGLSVQGNPARVFNYMSDGEVQEGSTWEAAMLAGARGFGNLTNIIDVNRTQADGALVLEIEPLTEKYRAFGWWAEDVDGNDIDAVADVFNRARAIKNQPKCIVAHTKLGYGSPWIMNSSKAHFVRVAQEDWRKVMAEVEMSK